MITDQSRLSTGRAQNFDALRFWAAMIVLWSHCFTLLDGHEEREPLHRLTAGQSNWGVVAVAFFFAISGFLITRSFERSRDVWTYVRARVLRIMPAFLVVLALQEFVLGPWLTTLSLREYWQERSPLKALLLEGLFIQEVGNLPGVFEAHPRALINGSLWTLRYEVLCYALVLALGVMRLLNRKVVLALYLGAIGWMGYFEHTLGLTQELGDQSPGPDRLLDLGAIFLAGALIYLWKAPLKAPYAFVCAVLLVASPWFGELRTAQRILLPYVVLYLAIAFPLQIPGFRRVGDLSYGIYLYAWPVTQCVIAATQSRDWVWVSALTAIVTVPLAALSWHLIEQRALRLKRVRSATPVAEPLLTSPVGEAPPGE